MQARLLLAALLLAALMCSGAASMLSSQQTPAQLESIKYSSEALLLDEEGTGVFNDLEYVGFTSNETHLIVWAKWRRALPVDEAPYNSIGMHRALNIHLDLDQRSDTGCCGPPSHWYANRFDAAISIEEHGYYRLTRIWLYNATGHVAQYIHNSSFIIQHTDTGIKAAIPYSILNVSRGDAIIVSYVESYTSVWDSMPSATNTSLMEADIAVDGSMDDWASQNLGPLITDRGDHPGIPYGYLNVTRLFMAVNRSRGMLYIGASLADAMPPLDSLARVEYGGGICTHYIYVNLDTNNDGSIDYAITAYSNNYVYIYSWASHRGRPYYPSSGIRVAENSSIIEVGIPLRYLGLNNYAPGGKITVPSATLAMYSYDSVHGFAGLTSRVIHVVGRGFYTASLLGATSYMLGASRVGVLTTANASVVVRMKDEASNTHILFSEYRGPPIPLEKTPPVMGSYYFLESDNSSNIEEVIFTAYYDENAVRDAGISVDSLRLYYYDPATTSFTPIKTLSSEDQGMVEALINPNLLTKAYGRQGVLLILSYGKPPSPSTTTRTVTSVRSTTITSTATITATITGTTTVTRTLVNTHTSILTSTHTITSTRISPTTSTTTATVTSTATHTETIPLTTTLTRTAPPSTSTITVEKGGGLLPWVIVAILAVAAAAALLAGRRT